MARRFTQGIRQNKEVPETLSYVQDPAVITTAIGNWYLENARDLPWRDPTLSAWDILLSEIMAQQTQVARVVPIWQRWRQLWPTPADLADAPTSLVLTEWSNLGYPRRALRLQECARIVTTQYDGQVPRTYAELIALPGIGEYTAGAVLAFAYGQRALVLDTNVRRVIARVFQGQQFPKPSLTVAEKQFAATLIPEDDAGGSLWAKASMELGATLCTARSTQCEICPVVDLCKWRAEGYPADEYATQRKTQKFAGTDRQVRGLIMAQIRSATEPVLQHHLDLVWPSPEQLGRCIDSLLTDGLIEIDRERFTFPTGN